jgi:hypothetical protein
MNHCCIHPWFGCEPQPWGNESRYSIEMGKHNLARKKWCICLLHCSQSNSRELKVKVSSPQQHKKRFKWESNLVFGEKPPPNTMYVHKKMK